MSSPRGRFSEPEQGTYTEPAVAVSEPRQDFIDKVFDDLNPLMMEAFVATCDKLGYEPILPIEVDPSYAERITCYDLARIDLKALASA